MCTRYREVLLGGVLVLSVVACSTVEDPSAREVDLLENRERSASDQANVKELTPFALNSKGDSWSPALIGVCDAWPDFKPLEMAKELEKHGFDGLVSAISNIGTGSRHEDHPSVSLAKWDRLRSEVITAVDADRYGKLIADLAEGTTRKRWLAWALLCWASPRYLEQNEQLLEKLAANANTPEEVGVLSGFLMGWANDTLCRELLWTVAMKTQSRSAKVEALLVLSEMRLDDDAVKLRKALDALAAKVDSPQRLNVLLALIRLGSGSSIDALLDALEKSRKDRAVVVRIRASIVSYRLFKEIVRGPDGKPLGGEKTWEELASLDIEVLRRLLRVKRKYVAKSGQWWLDEVPEQLKRIEKGDAEAGGFN